MNNCFLKYANVFRLLQRTINRQKKNLKRNIFLYYFLGIKWAKLCLTWSKEENKIVDLFIFRFIKIPPGADSNNLKRKIIFSPFEGNSQHFMRPCMRQVKKQPFKVKFWNWGSMKIWHNLPSGSFFAMGQFITCRWVGSWGLTKGEAGLVSSQYSQSYSFTSPAGVCVWRKQSINVIIPPFRPNYWI